jgi:hypothetical protein
MHHFIGHGGVGFIVLVIAIVAVAISIARMPPDRK